MEVESLAAVELYSVAVRTIALAGIYNAKDVGWALERLRSQQARYTRSEGDWQAYEHVINGILAAAME